MKPRQLLGMIILVTQLCSAQTNIKVIDFESLAQIGTDTASHGRAYSEEGFVFGAPYRLQGFATFQNQSPHYSGSTALFNNGLDDLTCLARTDAGVFDFLGLQVSKLDHPRSGTIVFTGYRGEMIVSSNAFFLVGDGGVQTFNATGFTNLTEVRWPSSSPTHQFDNIRVVARTNATQLTTVRISGADSLIHFSLTQVQIGKQYALQRSTDLVSWTNVYFFIPYSSALEVHDLYYQSIPSQSFYRLNRL